MKRHSGKGMRQALAAIALTWSIGSSAVTIDGISAFAPVEARNVSASTSAGGMEIRLPHSRKIVVNPWPEFLPSTLDAQTLQATRQLQPAGPADLLRFTHASEEKPWLIIGSNSQRATPVAGDWHVQFIDGKWFVTNGNTKKRLGKKGRQFMPATVRVDGVGWKVYLLDATDPLPDSRLAAEQEPRISWAAVRQGISYAAEKCATSQMACKARPR